MKFTLSWLKQHLETNASVQDIADKLTAIGLEVEEVKDRAAALKPFIIADIIKAEQHPNADRLRVCVVNTGVGEVQVVCGAPNARAGLRGVFAPAGSHVPGTGVDLKISSIRGVESRGMMCSAKEMTLAEESDGIIELPADAPLGASFAEYMGLADPVFEVKLTPNRPDCNGVYGIARDLAAAGMGTLKPLKIEKVTGSFKSPLQVKLNFSPEANNACPYFIGRAFKGVKNGPSPKWLQDKLTAIGLRPISALVDITNYLTFDHARPLHVFDMAKVKGHIEARLARKGETLEALNGKTYTLDETMTVIADAEKAEAIAGIIGGMESGCTETTTDVFLECAYFDPARTTLTGRALQIITDARYRFERGVDPAFMMDAVEIASRLIIECCGGSASDIVVAGAPPAPTKPVFLRADRTKTLGGMDVPLAEQEKLLKAVGCGVKQTTGGLEVTFPSWRPDMVGEADCVEEILRLKGFENIPAVSLPRDGALTPAAYTPAQKRVATMRRTLAARGLLETVTWSFMPSNLAGHFGDIANGLRLQNPISTDLDVMRPSILPNLLQAAARNSDRGFPDVALFEVGPIYLGRDCSVPAAKTAETTATAGVHLNRDCSAPYGATATAGIQLTSAAGIRAGAGVPRQWQAKPRALDAFDAKADVLAALDAARAPTGNLQATADAPSYFHPGRSGALRLGPNVLAYFGEIHPALVARLGLTGIVCGFEIFCDAIPLAKDTGPSKPLADMPALQPLSRDYAFIVAKDVTADKLLKAVKGADKAMIVNAEVFDVYEGKGVPEGQKSLAIAVTLQPREKSLTDAELEALSGKIIAAATKATGAVLRG